MNAMSVEKRLSGYMLDARLAKDLVPDLTERRGADVALQQ